MSELDSTARRLRVLVVDADHRVRESLSGLLAIGDELEVVGQTGHPGAALELCGDLRPDVVVVDPRLPDVANGLALVAQVRARCPHTIVLVLSWPAVPAEGSVGGVQPDGFVSKSAAPHELVEQIVAVTRAALAGRAADGPALARGRRPGPTTRAALSPMLDSAPARATDPTDEPGRFRARGTRVASTRERARWTGKGSGS